MRKQNNNKILAKKLTVEINMNCILKSHRENSVSALFNRLLTLALHLSAIVLFKFVFCAYLILLKQALLSVKRLPTKARASQH